MRYLLAALALTGCDQLFYDLFCDADVSRVWVGDPCDDPAAEEECARDGVMVMCVDGVWQIVRPRDNCQAVDPACDARSTG